MSDIRLADNGKGYITPAGVFPRVTQPLDLLAKPALIPWAVKVTCDYIATRLENMADLGGDIAYSQMDDLIQKARKESTRISEEAMDIGSWIHSWVNIHNKIALCTPGYTRFPGKTVPVSLPEPQLEEHRLAVSAYLEWENDVRLIPIMSERLGWNPRWRVAGTLDLIAKIKCHGWRKHRTYLVDLKAASGHYPEHLYQVAAYSTFEGLPKLDGIGVLRLDKKTGLPDWEDYTDEWRHGIKVYRNLRELYRLIKGV